MTSSPAMSPAGALAADHPLLDGRTVAGITAFSCPGPRLELFYRVTKKL